MKKRAEKEKTTRRRLSPWIRGLLVGITAFLFTLLLWGAGAFEGLERLTYDARVRLLRDAVRPETVEQNGKPEGERVVLVLLGDASLSWAEESSGITWPWPRELYAYLLNFLHRCNVASVSLDVLFVEPSSFGVYDDELFGLAIEAGSEGSPVVSAMRLSAQEGEESWPEEELRHPRIEGLDEFIGENPEIFEALNYPMAEFPIPEVMESVDMLGNVHLPGSEDGVYRRLPLFSLFDGKVVPSMGLAAYLAATPDAEMRIRGKDLWVDNSRIQLDDRGRAIPRYSTEEDTHYAYNAAALIQSEIQFLSGETPNLDPAELKGAHVLFGFSAAGLFDLRPTPLAARTPGVEVHATVLENLLKGSFIRHLGPITTALIVLLFSLLFGFMGAKTSRAEISVGLYLLAAAIPLGVSVGVYLLGYWFDLVFFLAAGLFTMAGSSVMNFATEGKQKRFIKGAFSQYLSPDVIEQLVANPDLLKLGGDRRELTIYFSDLQGFTSISEALSPEELTALLNDYLSAMTEIIQNEGGTIDKYEGDAIIAFWNAPVIHEDHAQRGVRASLECQKRLAELRPEFLERSGKDLYMRIGMNTGPAVVGNMGSHTRFDYSMLGDAVNLAARLEGVNKQFGTFTMISQDTFHRVQSEYAARELGRVAVVGRMEPVTVYEPMEKEAMALRRDRYDAFAEALALYYQGEFVNAAEKFRALADVDPPSAKYLSRCEDLAEKPPEDWKGVWVMTSK